MFKSLDPSGSISFNIEDEIYKQNGVNTYDRTDLKLEEEDQLVQPATIT